MNMTKHSVIYTKRVETRDPKTGQAVIIPKGKQDLVTDDELNGIRHAVRVVKPAKVQEPPREG